MTDELTRRTEFPRAKTGPLDDTMWDLILDGVGGSLGGLLGSVYMRFSTRTAQRIVAFSQLVPGGTRSLG